MYDIKAHSALLPIDAPPAGAALCIYDELANTVKQYLGSDELTMMEAYIRRLRSCYIIQSPQFDGHHGPFSHDAK